MFEKEWNIDYDRKLIFLHIPKTAGRSIKKLFGLPMNTIHSRPEIFITKEEWETFFTFCIVRHPIDRLLSSYFYHTKKSYTEPHNHQWLKGLKFKYFFMIYKHHPNAIIQQHNYITHNKSEKPIDYIVKFERLEETLQPVLDKFNIKGKLPHLNKSKRDLDRVKNMDLDKFIEYYKKDFEIFDYTTKKDAIRRLYLKPQ